MREREKSGERSEKERSLGTEVREKEEIGERSKRKREEWRKK